MQTAMWIGCCLSNTLAHTVVHFFPSAGNVTAPYPTTCKFRLVGQGGKSEIVSAEGARLSQPDGVRVEDLFPALGEGVPGFVGLEISLSTSQPRIDLSSSLCIVEFASRAFSARYRPRFLPENSAQDQIPPPQPLIRDAYGVPSLVLVNTSDQALQTSFLLSSQKQHEPGNNETQHISPPEIPARTISELEMTDYLESTEPIEASWGLVRLRALKSEHAFAPGTACYLVYRDGTTKVPVSVVTL